MWYGCNAPETRVLKLRDLVGFVALRDRPGMARLSVQRPEHPEHHDVTARRRAESAQLIPQVVKKVLMRLGGVQQNEQPSGS